MAELKEKEVNHLFISMADGIILGFFLIQGQAWLHRPYDTLRYLGMYSHPNMNALFYVCAYGAVLCRWYYMKLKRQHVLLRLPYILLAGLIMGTIAYTGSRSAIITLIPVTGLFLLFQMLSRRKWKLAELLLDGIVLVVSVTICILPAYWLIRYMPVYGNDPIYFEADTQVLHKKVQKDAPVDDPKYVEFQEAKAEMYKRYLWFLEAEEREDISTGISEWIDRLLPAMEADAAGMILSGAGKSVSQVESTEASEGGYVEPGSDPQHPLERQLNIFDGYNVRLDIYRYFWNKLTLIGQKGNVQGVWLWRGYKATHCHNLFLQFAYDFGIIIGVILIAVVIMVYIKVLTGMLQKKSYKIHTGFCHQIVI